MKPKSISETPMLQAVTIPLANGQSVKVMGYNAQLRDHLQDLRESVKSLQGQVVQNPQQPSSFTATGTGLGILLQWTRSAQNVSYQVLWNTAPSLINAHTVSLGNVGQFQDFIGTANVKRWYWVRGLTASGVQSLLVGPVSATSQAAAGGPPPPTPPPPSNIIVVDQTTGQQIPYTLDRRFSKP